MRIMVIAPSRRNFAAWIALVLLLTTGSAVSGQEPAAPASAAADAADTADAVDESAVVLDEITVTAQKREENVQDVPISITTLNAEQLNLLTAGGGDVKALSGRVPS